AKAMSAGRASTGKCYECGCVCHNCSSSHDLDYHHQIEELQRRLRDQRQCLSRLESDLASERDSRRSDSERQTEDLARLRDRYDRLLESHKRLSRVNAGLEEKLLDLAGKFDAEQRTLLDKLASSETKLAEAEQTVERLKIDRERCKTECEIAVRMLRARPDAYLTDEDAAAGGTLLDDELPASRAQTVSTSSYMTVPLPTFPPTFAHFPTHSNVYSGTSGQQRLQMHRAASVGDTKSLVAAADALRNGPDATSVAIRRGIFDV
ncbi:hypothetical protein BOX15_Mlig001290g7, partial [Macrostomum lignano]